MKQSKWDDYLNKAIRIPGDWLVWRIDDAVDVFGYLANNNLVIVGGDILTNCLEYTNDNWYYEPKAELERSRNVKGGLDRSCEYVTWYRQKFGNDFLVLIVVDRDTPLLA